MRTLIGTSMLICALFVPGVALASGSQPQPGVHVDPGSPAGKQYGFPVTSARGETSGSKGKAQKSSGGANPPLFGSGVTSPSTSTSTHTATTPPPTTSATTTATTTSGSHVKRHTHKRKRPKAVTGTVPPPSTAKPVSASLVATPAAATTHAGSNAWIPLVGGGLLVLLVGTAGGLALKRRL